MNKSFILHTWGFFKITSLVTDLTILSGLIITGPSGMLNFSSYFIPLRYSLVVSAKPIGLDDKYKILYPLFEIDVYNLAIP